MNRLTIIVARPGSATAPQGEAITNQVRTALRDRAVEFFTTNNIQASLLSHEIKNGELIVTLEVEEGTSWLRPFIQAMAAGHNYRGSFWLHDDDGDLIGEASMTSAGLKGRIIPKSTPTSFEDGR